MLLGAQLLDDVGQQVLDGLGFGLAAHDEGVVLDRGVGFGPLEVEDGVVVSEEVDLVHSEWVRSHLLDDVLDHLVVAGLPI